jgi:hypothetical protein
MMGKPAYETLDEFLTDITNYHGGWDAYKEKFFGYAPNSRIIELSAYDQLLENEHKVTREHAEWITKGRELRDIHNLLLRAGK